MIVSEFQNRKAVPNLETIMKSEVKTRRTLANRMVQLVSAQKGPELTSLQNRLSNI